MFNLVVKDPYSPPPKRCRLDRGLDLRPSVPELIAPAGFLLDSVRQHFCANFLKLSNFPLHVKANRDELNRFRRENRVLREEREILSKAAAWFAQETGATPSRRSHS